MRMRVTFLATACIAIMAISSAVSQLVDDGSTEWQPPKTIRKGACEPGTIGATRSRWKYNLNLDKVPEQPWVVQEDKHGKIIRVNLLKIKPHQWRDVPGVRGQWAAPRWDDTRFAWNPTRCFVDDLNGDGELDIFIVSGFSHAKMDSSSKLYNREGQPVYEFGSPSAQVVRMRESGEIVWQKKVKPCSGGEQIHITDLGGDGRRELVLLQRGAVIAMGTEEGKIRWRTELKSGQGDYSMGPLVGHFTDTEQYQVVVRNGPDVICFGPEGDRLWITTLGNDYGGDITHYDADGDGLGEIYVHVNGLTAGIDNDGSVLWKDKTQEDHSDFVSFGDLDADGDVEAVYRGGSFGSGLFYVVDAMSGELERKIDYGATGHRQDVQQLELADVRPDVEGLEVIASGESYRAYDSYITIWDARGNQLTRIHTPARPVDTQDWNGDGVPEILVASVGANMDPYFSVWTGRGERLYALSLLPCPTEPILNYGDYIASSPGGLWDLDRDRDGNGRPDIILPFGAWHFGSDQMLLMCEPPP